jgi:hypothetical protein
MRRKTIGITEARLASPNLNSPKSSTADLNIVFTLDQFKKLAALLEKSKSEGEGDYTIRVARKKENSVEPRRITVTFLPVN